MSNLLPLTVYSFISKLIFRRVLKIKPITQRSRILMDYFTIGNNSRHRHPQYVIIGTDVFLFNI